MKSKRVLVVILLILVILFSVGCGQAESPAVNSAESLFTATNRDELARMVNCNTEDLDQLLIYINNLNRTLPDAGYEPPASFERGVTEDDDLIWITREELRTMVKPTVLTTTNWKDYFEIRVDQQEWFDWNEDGEEYSTFEDVAVIEPKECYSYDWDQLRLEFINNETGEACTYDFGWSEALEIRDGKIFTVTYDDDWRPTYYEADLDHYTCTRADGILYEYSIPDDIISVGAFVEEEPGEDPVYRYFRLADCPVEYDESDEFVCVMRENSEYPWYIGLSAVGSEAYGER